jgi:hypothetical protein
MSRGVLWHNHTVGLALVPRSGSFTLFSLILKHLNPQASQESYSEYHVNERWHPVMNITEWMHDLRTGSVPQEITFAVVVRNPLDRFVSACARLKKTPDDVIANHLDDVHTWTIASMGLMNHPQARYFLFENLNVCAEYLGLPTPLPTTNSEPSKPNLTEDQLHWAKQYYSEDIELYTRLSEVKNAQF